MARKHRKSSGELTTDYRMNSAKYDVLRVLIEFDQLRSKHIAMLLPDRHPHGVLNTLKILHQAGLVEKPAEQFEYYNNIYDPDIYRITKLGCEKYQETFSLPYRFVRLSRPRSTKDPRIMFPHQMMICDSAADYVASARLHGVEPIALDRILERVDQNKYKEPLRLFFDIKHRFTKSKAVERKKDHLRPDNLIGFQYEDGAAFFADEQQNTVPVRRNNLSRDSMLRKLLAYADIQKRAEYRDQLQIGKLRVLFRFTKEEDFRDSLKLGKELFGRHSMFLFAHVPAHAQLQRAPKPNPDVFKMEWHRIGMEPVTLLDA